MLIIKIVFTIHFIFFAIGAEATTWKKINPDNFTTVPPEVTSCPDGYLGVPFLPPYTMRYFCVMKFEAKNDGYRTPVSKADTLPWIEFNQIEARSRCRNLGSGYDLISNGQWQTIARNIAGVSTNWSSGQLNRGHSDGTPAALQEASLSDVADNCIGTGQICSSTVWDDQRRTHVLSNGNIIWDFAGNAQEWVNFESTTSNGVDGYISQINGGDLRQTRYGALSSTICATPGSSPYCGMGHGDLSGTAGTLLRGGKYTDGVSAGVFATTLKVSTAANIAGFRCTFIP